MNANLWTLLSVFVAALLAGCTAGAGEALELSYEGTDSGTHDDSAECDDDATLVGTGNVEDGQVVLTVSDGSGDDVFTRTFDGGIDLEGEQLDGASGTWTVTAVRGGDDLVGDEFNGQYTFGLAC
jgi:hypothetical protein